LSAALAEILLTELAERGFSLRCVADGTLRCSPKSKLTEEDSRRIRVHREELLSLVSTKENVSSPIVPSSPPPTKADTYGELSGDDSGDDSGDGIVPSFVKERLERAERLGLVARWSYEFGYISVHDPTTGEWYDVATKDAPHWARREASKRKELRKLRGITRLLTQSEMEELYGGKRQAKPSGAEAGIVDPREEEAVGKGGVIYEDYLEED